MVWFSLRHPLSPFRTDLLFRHPHRK
jgi:hypothetical protein